MRRSRIIYTIILFVCLCAAIGAGYGYLSAHDSKKNMTFVGENTIEPEEPFSPPEELKPGESFQKAPSLKNTGNVVCYVRMLAECSDGSMQNLISMDFNNQEWTEKQSDGYYYYKLPLAVGETTKPLFTTVKISEQANLDKLKDFQIIVYGESIEQADSKDYQAAWQRWEKS